VKTVAAAVDPRNYDLLPPVTEVFKHEVTVKGDKEWGTRTRSVTWTNKPPPPRRLGPENIMTKGRSLSREAQNAETPLEHWEIFFTEAMLDLIVEHTNEKIREDLAKEKRSAGLMEKSPHLKLMDKVKYFHLGLQSFCFDRSPHF
jgi:hypothetical protein